MTAAVLGAGPAVAAERDVAGGGSAGAGGTGKPTVVLVHGAFADASGWNRVAERLMRDGYDVIAPANPLRSLTGDSAYIASVLKSIDGPIVLVGHSYGGAVISGAAAGNPNVKALVFVSAFMPDKGETLGALAATFPGSELQPALNSVPYSDGTTEGTDLYIKTDRFHSVFAADLPVSTTRLMAVGQRPISGATFEEKAGPAAWKTIPSWFVVAKNDKAIAPDLERFEAKRARSRTVEVDSSHAAMMSHPEVVTRTIRQAADATASGAARATSLSESGARKLALAGAGGLAGAAVLTGSALVFAGSRWRAPRR
ncbi:alpha/beta fold hydrolase [Streptomyces sp. NPDC004609]|uniref:alpha/beta fold hydrolase n=1 Tax=Streptomyces sp. NPDC004609 TaxID=3364704 RepID=UPI0036B39A59